MRYAVYFTPDQADPLTAAATRWLGRSAWSAAPVDQPELDWLDGADQRRLTEAPRRYGFHATLKPPFALAAGTSRDDLVSRVAAVAGNSPAIMLEDGLKVARLGPFFALVPNTPSAAIDRLAGRCVRELDGLRAASCEADLARRRAAGLTPGQEAHLGRWGYPYVFEDFRFHMTLTGPVPPKLSERMEQELHTRFDTPAGQPLAIDRLAVCVQPDRDSPFVVEQVMALAGSRRSPATAAGGGR